MQIFHVWVKDKNQVLCKEEKTGNKGKKVKVRIASTQHHLQYDSNTIMASSPAFRSESERRLARDKTNLQHVCALKTTNSSECVINIYFPPEGIVNRFLSIRYLSKKEFTHG